MEEAVLKVENLNKSFGKKQTLFDVNFECQTGRIVGLIGANGAGKTTIMKSILSLIKSQGKIIINGQITDFEQHTALKNVGALIEYPGIYPFLSGRDHLKLFVNVGKEENIDRVVKELRLKKYIDQEAKTYSLGMKQKLGIAMALVNDPQLVILDEPMNGLDPQSTKDLRELILKRKQSGVTFLISSHILGELQKLAEDLIVINHGKVVKKTTMTQLLDSNQHYVILSTNDDSQAEKLLNIVGFEIVSSNPLKVVLTTEKTIERIIKILQKQNINVSDLQHEDADLEESVLKIITERE